MNGQAQITRLYCILEPPWLMQWKPCWPLSSTSISCLRGGQETSKAIDAQILVSTSHWLGLAQVR